MSRSARANLPRPDRSPVARPGQTITKPDGEQAQYSGAPIDALPAVVDGIGHDKMATSANLAQNAGGDPVLNVVEDADFANSPPVDQYEVTGDKNFNITTGAGYRAVLRPGKVVSASNYDIALLKRQGVKLRKLVPEVPEALDS